MGIDFLTLHLLFAVFKFLGKQIYVSVIIMNTSVYLGLLLKFCFVLCFFRAHIQIRYHIFMYYVLVMHQRF